MAKKMLLDNGLRLVAVEMPHLHSAELAIYIKVGGRNDPKGKAGLSHFLEHMLFRGAGEFPSALELETAFEAIGGNINASTDEESTCVFSRINPAFVRRGVEILSQMILLPHFSEVETEKKIVAEEALDDLNEKGEEINPQNLANSLLWPDHSLGIPTIGYLNTISSFTEADLKEHIGTYYRPSNAVLVVAGNINTEEFFQAARDYFGNWAGGLLPLISSPIQLQKSPVSVFVSDVDSQVHLNLAFRGLDRHSPYIMPLRLIRRILSESGSARLYMNLREKLGIVYSIDSNMSAYDETGYFSIELSTAPENVELAVTEVLSELSRLKKELITRDEFERIKQSYFFELGFSRDSGYEMQVRYGWGELMEFVRSIEDDIDGAERIDETIIQKVASDIFRPENLNFVMVGTWKDSQKASVLKIINGNW
ncbi:MAG: insulinase family protein [Desulfuromonadales bacterium]|nr:insulinase family protein [Desulfuromonadales bacterium]